MENGHWTIPFTTGIVVKNVGKFEACKIHIGVSLTLLIRFKFNGLKNIAEVMDYV